MNYVFNIKYKYKTNVTNEIVQKKYKNIFYFVIVFE